MVNTAVLVAVLVMIFAMMAIVVVFAMSYKTFPPNQLVVLIRGNRKKGTARYRLMRGTGKFMMPGSGAFTVLAVGTELVEFIVDKVPTTHDGRPTSVLLKVAAIWKISSDEKAIMATAESLIDRTRGENEIAVRKALENALMNMGPSLSVNSFRCDRDAVSARIDKIVNPPLQALGLELRDVQLLKVKHQG